MHRSVFLVTVVLGVAAGTVATAHHPYRAYYLDREITIAGALVRWTYGEPHSFMHVEERDEHRRARTWIVELNGASRLKAHGITSKTLRPGEYVTVTGSLGRVAADRRVRMRIVIRQRDGWTWSDP